MKKILGVLIIPIVLLAFIGIAEAAEPIDYSQIARDYQMMAMSKNPCATNPCATKNPCAVKNPCATNPCATNPCAVKNPCANSSLKHGERLWKDVSLGNSGKSCSTCHLNGKGLYNTPYPKYIKMPDKVVSLKEMINFCMKVPMKAPPLDVNGPKMEALVAYINAYSSSPNPCGAMNPCGMSNPCAVKNPCGAM